MTGKHWTQLPPDKSHFFARDGHCKGCMMERGWPGAREACTMPYTRPKRKPRFPFPPEVIVQRFDRIEWFKKTKPRRLG